MSQDSLNNKNAEKTARRDLSHLASIDMGAEGAQEAQGTQKTEVPVDPIDAIATDEAGAPSPFETIGAAAAPAPDAPEPKAPAKKHGKLWIVPVVVAGLAGAAYLGGVAYFSDHFLPNTAVDGTDYSLKTRDELVSAIDSETDGYSLKVSGAGVELTLAAADVDLGYDGTAYADDAFGRANAWAWPFELTKSRDIKLDKKLAYDKDKVAAAIAPFVEKSQEAAKTAEQNAKIAYDQAQSSFVLENGGDTRSLNGDAAAAKVCAALDALQPSLTLGDDCMTSGDDFSEAIKQANSYLASAPTLTLAGSTVTTITAEQIASWVKFGDDLSISLDSDAITAWCRGDLSKSCDTVGTTRTYTRPDGKQVSVSGGSYGWNINGADTATKIVEALQSGQKSNIDIPTYSQGASYAAANGGKDWGNRFIDVDLAEQHARMYDDSGNLVWETDIVTGDTTKDHGTPCGVYVMDSYRAQGDVELRGAIDPATNEPEYISHVDYWMPFIGNSYALHDADWRSKFGGKVYEGNGSHGCVNLPVDKAKELFGLTKIGDIVVVHN